MMQAKVLIGQEKHEAAIRYLTRAEKENNMDCDVYITKGIAYANLSRYEEAKKEFEKALAKAGKSGDDRIFWFASSDALAAYLSENQLSGYSILIKGSHSMRMEKTVQVL